MKIISKNAKDVYVKLATPPSGAVTFMPLESLKWEPKKKIWKFTKKGLKRLFNDVKDFETWKMG